MSNTYDVIILGAGASGLFCAIEAAKRGRRVAILEHNDQPGKKILISGGGRANFTNLHASIANYVSKNEHFARSALARYTQRDFINFVEKHRIPFYEKKLGQLFCETSAKALLNALLNECQDHGVELVLPCSPRSVKKNDAFTVETTQGNFQSKSLVIATGGISIPKIGATDIGYRLAENFGHQITQLSAALCGFSIGEPLLPFCRELSGISVPCTVTCGDAVFEENMLFTHWGMSGPCMLQASLYWSKGDQIHINLLPSIPDLGDSLIEKKVSRDKRLLMNILKEHLSEKFLVNFFNLHRIQNQSLQDVSNAQLERISICFHAWKVEPKDVIGYERAEVTRGGVSTEKVSSQTMESKLVPGLYFIGEVLDVTGQLGGFNFQWAWSSGWVAGQYA